MKSLSKMIRSLMLSTFVMSFAACSYQPEDAGQCKLVCGSSVIAANNPSMSIKVKSLPVETECAADAAGRPLGPYKAVFLIGETIADETGAGTAIRPVPYISIEPLLIGNRPAQMNENDNDPSYIGLLTLKDNWCSDACGVVTLSAASACPGPGTSNDLSIQIHSGALFNEEPAVFPISTKDVETQ